MVKSYSTKGTPPLNQLTNVVVEGVANNDTLVYEDGLWKNKSDFISGDITCDNLQVLGTANVVGELSTDAVTKLFNDRYTFGPDAEFEGNLIVDTAQNTLYVDTINHRVGINKVPTEDLDVDGNIQINTNGTEKITFYDNGHDHEHGKLLFTGDGTDGSEFEVHTLTDGGSVTQKLTINNAGAIGLGATPDYGTTGSVLTSNGSSSAPTWNAPYLLRVYCDTLYQPADNTTTTMRYWVNDTDFSTTNYNSDFTGTGAAGGEWTCPQTGYYSMNIQAWTSAPGPGTDDGNLVKSILRLELQPSGGSYAEVRRSGIQVSTLESGSDDIHVFAPRISSILYVESGEKVKATIQLDQRITGDSRYVSQGTARTYWEIHRVA